MGNEIERTWRAPSAVGRVTPCAPSWQSKMRSPNRLVSRNIRRCDEPERVGWQTAARRGLHALPTADLPWHNVGRARHSVRAAPATGMDKISPASSSQPVSDPRFSMFPRPDFGVRVEPEIRNGQRNRKDLSRAQRGRARHSVRAVVAKQNTFAKPPGLAKNTPLR